MSLSGAATPMMSSVAKLSISLQLQKKKRKKVSYDARLLRFSRGKSILIRSSVQRHISDKSSSNPNTVTEYRPFRHNVLPPPTGLLKYDSAAHFIYASFISVWLAFRGKRTTPSNLRDSLMVLIKSGPKHKRRRQYLTIDDPKCFGAAKSWTPTWSRSVTCSEQSVERFFMLNVPKTKENSSLTAQI